MIIDTVDFNRFCEYYHNTIRGDNDIVLKDKHLWVVYSYLINSGKDYELTHLDINQIASDLNLI